MNPKFSIIIPFHNRAEFAVEVISSALNQEYKNFEVIVVDDGSTDEVPQILKSYSERIKIITQKNMGSEAARNSGIFSATGDYIVFLDSDDILLPWTLKTYADTLRHFHFPPIVISKVHLFRIFPEKIESFRRNFIKAVEYPSYILKDRQIFTTYSMMIIRREVLLEIGGCTQSQRNTFLGDDFDLLLRLSNYGPAILIEEPKTVLYRVHSANVSVNNTDKMAEAILGIIEGEKKGIYADGIVNKFDRYAYLGGPAFDWGRRSIKAGHYHLGFLLLIKGLPMILAKLLKKTHTVIKGKTRSITLQE